MKNEALYHKTVDILVQAYFNDTLQEANACGCVVGNLVAAGMGYEIKKNLVGTVFWSGQSYPSDNGWSKVHDLLTINWDNYNGLAKEQIDSTGYSPLETWEIEIAFESNCMGNNSMFNALMAVINTLDTIHENTDNEITETSKRKFVKV